MASPLVFKVYNDGEHIAALRFAEDAAVVVGNTGAGTVKVDGRIVWREGKEDFLAGDSFDRAADVMHSRRRDNHARRYARILTQQGRGVGAALLQAHDRIARSQDVAGVLDALAAFERNTKAQP